VRVFGNQLVSNGVGKKRLGDNVIRKRKQRESILTRALRKRGKKGKRGKKQAQGEK